MRDLTKISASVLKANLATYTRQLPAAHAQARIDAVEAEFARRANRASHVGPTAGYVLTATGQFEHILRDATTTRCGAKADPTREYGTAEWWHCLTCQR